MMETRAKHSRLSAKPTSLVPHPEMGNDDGGHYLPNSATILANELRGQLGDATDKVERILCRLHGPTPKDGDLAKGSEGLINVLAENVTAGGLLLRLLDQVENSIGGQPL